MSYALKIEKGFWYIIMKGVGFFEIILNYTYINSKYCIYVKFKVTQLC